MYGVTVHDEISTDYGPSARAIDGGTHSHNKAETQKKRKKSTNYNGRTSK